MLPFALTIFTGAFLLFQVQPLIGKYILPWFGGSPGVWTTCLLFFQTLLLGGYAYAHVSTTWLRPRMQAIVHVVLLALALACLPITPSESWKPVNGEQPVWHILQLLTVCVGLPYFVLSSTGPLMQRWFSLAQPGLAPYRLYALSNVGSLLALLSYPVWFEVKFSRSSQALWWSGGLAVFAVLCGYCAYLVWRLGAEATASAPTPVVDTATPAAEPATAAPATPWIDRVFWIGLPAIASLLLLAFTNKLCQEIAVIPFLWVLPLALYLLSFIICFDHDRWYKREIFAALLVMAIAVVLELNDVKSSAPIWLQVSGYSLALFVVCMVCHGELYRLRPAPRHLTAFYLSISAGGALGGFFVAVAAPLLFTDFFEFSIGLGLVAVMLTALCFRHRSRDLSRAFGFGLMAGTLAIPLLRIFFDTGPNFASIWHDDLHAHGWMAALWHVLRAGGAKFFSEWYSFYAEHGLAISGMLLFFGLSMLDFRQWQFSDEWWPGMGVFVGTMSAAFVAGLIWQASKVNDSTVIRASRNFYGTLKVFDYNDEMFGHYYSLMHGATTHGMQFVNPTQAKWITSYYGEKSGIGCAMKALPAGPRHIGVVGLGSGTMALYGRAGDTVEFYEINSAVEKIARDPFSHLAITPAKVTVTHGDARLSMERELADGTAVKFDVLVLDAFSSDAIPAHLLTRESVEMYLKHMSPDGVLAVHISNRYLNLEPVVNTLAAELDLEAVTISDDFDADWWIYDTTWMLVSRNRTLLKSEPIASAADTPPDKPTPPVHWTDDHVSLYEILKR